MRSKIKFSCVTVFMTIAAAQAGTHVYVCEITPATPGTPAVERELTVDPKGVMIQFGDTGSIAWDQPSRPAGVPHGFTKIDNHAPGERLWDEIYIEKAAFDGESKASVIEAKVLETEKSIVAVYPCVFKN